MVEITGEHEYVASRKEQDRERERGRGIGSILSKIFNVIK